MTIDDDIATDSNRADVHGDFIAPAIARDLLVMGGYGHSWLREWVFGGFTQLVLAAAPLPVMIAH